MTEELNRRHNLATMPTINNNGESYIVPFDIYKEGYDAYDISNWFKGRVGDNGTPFGIRWYKHGQLMDVTGMRPFIEGQVGDYTIDDSDPDDPKINMDSEASNVHVVGEVNDCQEYGVAIYRLINQAMPQSGIFYGKIGVMGTQDDGTTVMSSVDVIFKVLAGHMNMMGARKFYVSELEKAWLEMQAKFKQYNQEYKDTTTKQAEQFKADTEKALADLNTKIANEIKRAEDNLTSVGTTMDNTKATLLNLSQSIGETLSYLKAHDIVTQDEFQQLATQLAHDTRDAIKNVTTSSPKPIDNLNALQTKYPQGTTGYFLAKDNHHIYVWVDKGWEDFGVNQGDSIQDGSVNERGLSFLALPGLKSKDNLVDPTTAIYGAYYYSDNTNHGSQITDPTMCYIKIPAKPLNDLYIYGTSSVIVFTNDSNEIISKYPAPQYFSAQYGTSSNGLYKGKMPELATNVYISFKIAELPKAFVGYVDTPDSPIMLDPDTLSDQSLTSIKEKFQYLEEPNVNHYCADTTVDGEYIDYTTGNILPKDDYCVSDYIQVDPRNKYKIESEIGYVDGQLAFYDSRKAYISGINLAYNLPNTTLPATARYMRITMHKDQKDSIVVKKIQWLDTSEIRDNSLLPIQNKVPYEISSKYNLLSDSSFKAGCYIDYSSGNELLNSDYAASDFVPIDSRYKYEFADSDGGNCDSQFAFYDRSKRYISGLVFQHQLVNSSIPENACYLRTTIHKGQENTIGLYTINPISTEDVIKTDTVYVGNGKQFSTIKDALLYSLNHRYLTIRVCEGTYDIQKELGADYFNNYTEEYSSDWNKNRLARGLPLANDVTLIFDSKAQVIFDYEGDNSRVKSYFSLFATIPLGTGATVIGLNARAKNCHYIIHDDLGSYAAEHQIKTKFDSCNFYLDNTHNSAIQNETIIGGGLTFDQYVEITNNVFDAPDENAYISYHNHVSSDSRSILVLKDNYFAGKNSRFQTISCGKQNQNSLFLVSNNSFGSSNPISYDKLNENDETNITVRAWNNEIRKSAN